MASTEVVMSPSGAINHQLMDDPERPGRRARLNKPRESIAPPGPLVMAEHTQAAATLQSTAKRHLAGINRDIVSTETPSGTRKPNATRVMAVVVRISTVVIVLKKCPAKETPSPLPVFHDSAIKSVPSGVPTRQVSITIRHREKIERCFNGKYGITPDSCSHDSIASEATKSIGTIRYGPVHLMQSTLLRVFPRGKDSFNTATFPLSVRTGILLHPGTNGQIQHEEISSHRRYPFAVRLRRKIYRPGFGGSPCYIHHIS
jgi:hypothetical protein